MLFAVYYKNQTKIPKKWSVESYLRFYYQAKEIT